MEAREVGVRRRDQGHELLEQLDAGHDELSTSVGKSAFHVVREAAIGQLAQARRRHGAVYEDKRMPVAISIGISTLQAQNYASPKALVKAADDYLYKAKGNGRNRTESAIVA